MPAQVAVLSRKVFLDSQDIQWISEPMYWGGYKKAEIFVEAHGLQNLASPSVDLVFEGATEPGENANWQTMTDTGSALVAKGVSKFETSDIYPYVRLKVTIADVTGGLRAAELSINGQLFEE